MRDANDPAPKASERPAQKPALPATDIAPRAKRSNYPAPFAARMEGREKRQLGNHFGLTKFGVNLTRLAPGSVSALRHAHTAQDEFVYVLEGAPTLVTDDGEQVLGPGMCVGFPHGTGNAHHLVNRAASDAVVLEVGDRGPGDGASYPDDDLVAKMTADGWAFTHKDGTPWE